MNQVIKKYSYSFFGDECKICGMQNNCISPSSILSDERHFFLKLMGHHQKQTNIMRKGVKFHERIQSKIRTIEEMTLLEFYKKLRKGELILLKELKMCSPLYGFRGIADIISIQKNKNKIDIKITEIKSGHNFKKYMKQLACYGLILSDYNCMFYIEVKEKSQAFKLYLDKWSKNIELELFLKDKKQFNYIFMENNLVEPEMEGFSWALRTEAKKKRRFMQPGIYYLEETDKCRWCEDKIGFCSLWEICSKVKYRPRKHSAQRYFGEHKLIVKNRKRRI